MCVGVRDGDSEWEEDCMRASSFGVLEWGGKKEGVKEGGGRKNGDEGWSKEGREGEREDLPSSAFVDTGAGVVLIIGAGVGCFGAFFAEDTELFCTPWRANARSGCQPASLLSLASLLLWQFFLSSPSFYTDCNNECFIFVFVKQMVALYPCSKSPATHRHSSSPDSRPFLCCC